MHCYAESSPAPVTANSLRPADYHNLIDQAANLGCRKLQFIGGEPTLVRELPEYIRHARSAGFELVEVFTNAISISDKLLDCFVENNVAVATSFYADIAEIHDGITKRPGSYAMTVRNIQRIVAAGLAIRAGIIVMAANYCRVDATVELLNRLGVRRVGVDRVRAIGRGNQANSTSQLNELCGSCWQGSLSVFPDGRVAPCIMARAWTVGSILTESLANIVYSDRLSQIRNSIYKLVWLPKVQASYLCDDENSNCNPGKKPNCNPNCVPVCNPRCSPNCSPCFPSGKCNPELFCGPCNPGPCHPTCTPPS